MIRQAYIPLVNLHESSIERSGILRSVHTQKYRTDNVWEDSA